MIGSNPTDSIVANEFDKSDFISALIKNKETILFDCISAFNEKSKLNIVFGFEIEFYIRLSDEIFSCAKVSEILNSYCQEIDLFDEIEQEKGDGQYEIKTKASDDVLYLLRQTDLIIKSVNSCCAERGFEVIYDARPFSDDCPNAFQVNFSLSSQNGENIFANNSKIAADIADFTTLHLDELLLFSNEKDEDFLRYELEYNLALFKKGKFIAPTTKSWGFDNRSCAVRVLSSVKYEESARIELRIASNNIEKHLFLAATAIILEKFLDILDYESSSKGIYGNSFDDKYSLDSIARSYSQARDSFFKDEAIVFPEMLRILETKKSA